MKTLIYLLISLILISCTKDFLDVKPGSDTVVPTTLEDFQQLMDNGSLVFAYPDMLDVLADDYYLEESYWNSLTDVIAKNAHIWADDIFGTQESDLSSWERGYEQIFYANVVLEGVEKIAIERDNEKQHHQVMGTAHCLRAWALYNLVQLYAPAYNKNTASGDLGVPIPLQSDVNEKVKRNSVEEVYGRIIDDLEKAGSLVQQEVDFGRPSKAAVYALHARVSLAMGDYEKALEMANSSLQVHDALIDLNIESLDYKKTLYMALEPNGHLVHSNNQNIQIVDDLYLSYEENDLRKSNLRINKAGKPYFFCPFGYFFRGLDSDEQYMIIAECHARLGHLDESMAALNYLLKHVHRDYVEKTADTTSEVLKIIAIERRKQLIFRGVRWMDLKRYNRDGANITLTRKVGATTYTLPATSNKWLFPIPPNEIKTSGLTQNAR